MQFPTALVLALAVVTGSPSDPRPDDRLPEAAAPDGARGLGTGLDPRLLARVFRDPVPEDGELLRELWDLARDVDVLGSVAAVRYEQLGYFVLVDDSSARLARDVDALHQDYRAYDRRGLKIALGERRGLALARAMADPYFLARMKVLVGTEYDVEQLRRALAILVAHAHGRAELRGGSELDELTRRADLAAARLRAARQDLEALYQPAVPEGARGDSVDVLQLARAFARGRGDGASELRQRVRQAAREEEKRLSEGALAKFDRDHEALLQGRAERTRTSIRAYTEVLTLLPFEPDGSLPADLEGRTSERYRQAADTGLEAARNDPLIPEVQYMLGLAFDFFAGRELSLPRFDRFLALRGIRHWDHRTFQGRALSDREEWALFVVAGWKPPQEPSDQGR